jgi:hypothetical protein
LGCQKGFQLASHDLIEERLFGVARPVGRIGNHEGIAGCNPRRNTSANTVNEIGQRKDEKVRAWRDNLVALITTSPTLLPLIPVERIPNLLFSKSRSIWQVGSPERIVGYS